MKTTIDIADDLLTRAKKTADRQGTTLKAVVERALRLLFSQRSPGRTRINPVVVKGRTPPEVFGWEAMRKALYDDDELTRLRRAGHSENSDDRG